MLANFLNFKTANLTSFHSEGTQVCREQEYAISCQQCIQHLHPTQIISLYIKIMVHLSAVGETWRIEHYEVILPPFFDSFYYILPRISSNTGKQFLRKPIIRKVFLCPSRIVSIQVHRLDPLRSAFCSVNRERSSIGEQVQYRQSRTHSSDHLPSQHMVKKQSGIDTLGQINGKSQSILRDLHQKRLFTLQFMLFLAYSRSAMKHYMGSLDI